MLSLFEPYRGAENSTINVTYQKDYFIPTTRIVTQIEASESFTSQTSSDLCEPIISNVDLISDQDSSPVLNANLVPEHSEKVYNFLDTIKTIALVNSSQIHFLI